MKTKLSGYSPRYYIQAAKKLDLSHKIIHSRGLIKIFNNNQEHFFYFATPDLNSAITSALCRNKALSIKLLRQENIPTPTQLTASNTEQANKAILNTTLPIVIKPADGTEGSDVYTNINSTLEAKEITKNLLTQHKNIIIENHIQGNDYRFLVLNKQVIGIIQRKWPTVTGDGKSTIKQLIKKHPKFDRIGLNGQVISILRNQSQTLTDILEKEKVVRVRPNANQATGGTTIGYLNQDIHSTIIQLAITAAQTVQAQLCGVDIMIKNHSNPAKNNAYIIELNHAPCFAMHLNPDFGPSRDTATDIIKEVFSL